MRRAERQRTLDSHGLARRDLLPAKTVEYSYTCAKQGCELHRIGIFGDSDDRFSAKNNVFGIPAVTSDAINKLVVAHLETALLAVFASPCMQRLMLAMSNLGDSKRLKCGSACWGVGDTYRRGLHAMDLRQSHPSSRLSRLEELQLRSR